MNQKKSRILSWIVISLLLIIPLFLWIIAPSPLPRFESGLSSLANIGQILGLCGAVLFAMSIILSAKIRKIENYFHGLNDVYLRHNQIGQVAFMMLLFHPLFLIYKYSGSFFTVKFRFFSPGSSWAENWGFLALATMIILIVITLYLRPKYNIWKWTHKFLGLALFFASLHIYLIPSDVSRYLPLRIYMLAVVLTALIAFSYHTLLGKWLIKKYIYTVANVIKLNTVVVEIHLAPQKDSLAFEAGQFVFVKFLDKNIGGESHPFSLVSAPGEKNLVLAIKKLGDYTKNIDALHIGSQAIIEGPHGIFSYRRTRYQKQIWIAGGIGITPFMSMAHALKNNVDYSVDLYYCVKDEHEAIYLNELKGISQKIHIILHRSKTEGRISADIIAKKSNGFHNTSIFMCAPVPMIQSLKQQFLLQGVQKKDIHSEEFHFD